MRKLSRRIRNACLPPLAASLIKAMFATLRIRHVGSDEIERMNREQRNYIVAFWHSDNLYAIRSHIRLPAVPVISHHSDGELMVAMLRRFGVEHFARGSSTRGGAAAMREMLRWARRGERLAIAPDGPKGPVYEVKEGVVALSRLSGLPIIPIRFHPERAWNFTRSWDRSRLPKPFTRAIYLYGPSLAVARTATGDEMERARVELEQRMNELRVSAGEDFARLWQEGARMRRNRG